MRYLGIYAPGGMVLSQTGKPLTTVRPEAITVYAQAAPRWRALRSRVVVELKRLISGPFGKPDTLSEGKYNTGITVIYMFIYIDGIIYFVCQ